MNSTQPNSALLRELSKISPTKRADLLMEIRERLLKVKLSSYSPYSKQAEFHAAGAKYRERLLRAGNQLGKTLAGSAEAAYHLTGKYPEWWQGRRWDRPTYGWVGGPTGLSVRDAPQKVLLGRPGSLGTGMIPAADIAGYTMARSVADLVDTVRVKHVSGGISTIGFKSYESGREKWQGETLDWVWFDEEPNEEIYTEGLTRTNATGGIVWMTFTPLLGMSTVVKRFLTEVSPDRHDTNMVLEDALHIPAEKREQLIASYKPHEREARIKGTPILGSGRVFPVVEDDIASNAVTIPDIWPRIGGMDFGWDHPFAAIELCHDTESDIVYVTKCYRKREETPAIHAIALKPWGKWLPWSWPRDGRRETLEGAGLALARQFKEQGLEMLGTHAQFTDGSVSVEAGLMDMLDRMQSGRFKVFRHLNDWFEEFRLYHRKDGLVVKEADDLMCLHGDTMVVTSNGSHRIADLVGTEGLVLTVGGRWTRYKDCRRTRKNADLVRLDFADGSHVISTPDHRFLTPKGWVQAIAMEGENCHTSVSSGNYGRHTCALSFWTRIGKSLTGWSIPASADISGASAFSFTGLSGHISMVLFLSNIISTMWTVIGRTIKLKIFWPFPGASIYRRTIKGTPEGRKPLSRLRRNGERLRLAGLSIESWAFAMLTSCTSLSSFLASSALNHSRRSLAGTTGSVPMYANRGGGGPRTLMMRTGHAQSVGRGSELTASKAPSLAPAPAERPSVLQSAVECLKVSEAGRSDVYCMEVRETSAFAIETGLIVHNCSTRYALMMLRKAECPPRLLRKPVQAKQSDPLSMYR